MFQIPLLIAAAMSPYIGDVGAPPPPKPPAPTPSALLMDAVPRSFIQLTAKERSSDYIEAFNMLKREKGTDKVFFHLIDGSSISGIVEVSPTSQNTLLFLRYNSPQGVQVRVVPLETIVGLGTL